MTVLFKLTEIRGKSINQSHTYKTTLQMSQEIILSKSPELKSSGKLSTHSSSTSLKSFSRRNLPSFYSKKSHYPSQQSIAR